MASSESAVAQTPSTNKYTTRVMLKTIFERSDGGVGFIGQRIVIGGWVKSSMEIRMVPEVVGTKDVSCVEALRSRFPLIRSIMKVFRGEGDSVIRDELSSDMQILPPPSFSILKVSDGSCVKSLQVLVDTELVSPSQVKPTGTCIVAEGILQQPALLRNHNIALKVDKILHLGAVDENKYPLSKKRMPLEFFRDWPHFRTRTTTAASVMRIRNAITQALHTFFKDNEFLYVQVPTITSTDIRGSSKKFIVTTPLTKDGSINGINLEDIKALSKEKSKLVEELKRSESNREALDAAVQDLKKTNDLLSQLEAQGQDFFSHQMYLTASGRLHLESQACALGNVYTYGPRFQAEKSESKKSLAEIFVVETQMAFSKLEDAMNCAEDLLKFICNWVLEKSTEDLNFLSKQADKSIVESLKLITSCSPERISYTEAVEILKQATVKKFGNTIEWGVPLSDEHNTSYLVDEFYKRPVIIFDHPKEVIPFYVRVNDDAKTVAAFDILLPKVGTVVRGCQSEERLKTLCSRMEEFGLSKQQYEWYLDLRRNGTAQHSGFSLMLDSLVLFATGLNDIKDVVPFPVSPTKASV